MKGRNAEINLYLESKRRSESCKVVKQTWVMQSKQINFQQKKDEFFLLNKLLNNQTQINRKNLEKIFFNFKK